MVGKAHQRTIREREASMPLSDLFPGVPATVDLGSAVVREIDYATAKSVIARYEWLGNMGTTEFAYGLYFDGFLGGVTCFGRTAGTGVYASVCGEENAGKVITLCRGACVHWAHPHSASFLIPRACRLMVGRGFNVFVAYSDNKAGEVGTVYQASNWLYCGETTPTEKFVGPDGRERDARLVHAYTRDRRGGVCRYKRTRAEQKCKMIEAGWKFYKGHPKGRYVGIYGDAATVRRLRKCLRWPVLPYPKRGQSIKSDTLPQAEGRVQFPVAALSSCSTAP